MNRKIGKTHGRAALASFLTLAMILVQQGAFGQQGAKNGDWRFYGGDAGTTKYSALDQINAGNIKDLKIVWQWKAQNFGKRPDFNWEVTPLAVGGILYFTAGIRRDAVAVDGATGETLWMYRLDEGARGSVVARQMNRGLSYWTDGKADERVIMISPGYQMVALNAKNGAPIQNFGTGGLVDLTKGLDRAVVKPGQIGSSSPAIIIRDTIVVGAALLAGNSPPSKENVPGYIRGYDVRTGKLVWTFHTVPQAGEFGNETWLNDSWKYTGNTGAWPPLTADEELGYVYIPVEMPTGDYYGGTRPGNNLFSDSIVCLDAKTGKRIWHYQTVHHDVWDMDITAAPMLLDVNHNGKRVKAVAVVSKQAFTYVFDRVTGEPLWPIAEKPVPKSDVPGEWSSPTQPFPTKPAPFDRQGITEADLIDYTPAIKAEALKIASEYKIGPLFTPAILSDAGGKKATLMLPSNVGGANWQGGAVDPETGMMYVSSVTQPFMLALAKADPKRSDMGYVGTGRGPGGRPLGTPLGDNEALVRPEPKLNIGPGGLPLTKGPWGRITAIDLNSGDHAWMIPNGDTPAYIKDHPLMQGVKLDRAGIPSRAPLMVTKTLLFSADGANLFNSVAGGGGNTFRAIDKKTGTVIHEMQLPASATGIPMTYMADGRQFVVVAIGAAGYPAELVALALP
ncbi:MAG TPA: pyrroloquinoline quinone-dependent dehydrogenase [Bryobacteraceae bacterium]|nr:pyrroloquinoline quinone-dependent dehydrogenase [Bryobacteraceae bacterium]